MSTALIPIHNQLPAVANDVDSYLLRIHSIPVLSAEEEYELAQRLRTQGDLEAAQKLILSNLRFVVHIARGYLGYGLALGDLVQEGNIGLMKAVKRFDPERGVRLVSFAVHWIRAEIHDFVVRNWRIVKVATTKAQRKLFFKLRSNKNRLGWFNRQEVENVAQDLGVKPETVLEMEQRLSSQDVAYDLRSRDDEEESVAPVAFLADQNADPASQIEEHDWQEQKLQSLEESLDVLDERSRDILQKRWLSEQKATLHELADQYQVSAERIRQLENNAIKKLRAAMEA